MNERSRTVRAKIPPMAYGGDYNPEQWPLETQLEDIELMQQSGVDLVTLGVFSWAHLQPSREMFTFDWLDEVMDRLHAGGIRVDLATATASPPPWLSRAHPEMLPVTAEGTTLWPGGRQHYCPSSPVYREAATTLARAMGERYGNHPALVLWHVSNEIGCHNALCYCDTSAAHFRQWLQQRYGDLDALNAAWGTAFWSQRYFEWDEILPPRVAPNFPNPTHQLDYRRFSSDALLELFVMERDVLHDVSPGVPVTTNFMVMHNCEHMDYYRWGKEVDVVSNDHYQLAAHPQSWRELSFSADMTRGVAGGDPWLLMETSTSAVNWQPRNVAKKPGELLRAGMQHVSRGADALLFFQWRASKAGAEKYHAGLVPHAGTDTRLWREVCGLGAALDRLHEVTGSRSDNKVALLFDYQARWGCELDSHPSVDVRYLDLPHAFHSALTDLGVGVDVVHPSADLSAYDLVIVPTLYLVTDADASNIAAVAERGGTVLVTYFSGIVDESDHIRMGGYPGAFRDLLGISSEEFTPLREGETVRLDTGETATIWSEDLKLRGAEAIATYVDGPVPGTPAITRHRTAGGGQAWYVATRLGDDGIDALTKRLVEEASVQPVVTTTPGVEVARRVGAEGRSWLFVINHTDQPAELSARGTVLLDSDAVGETLEVNGSLRVEAGGVVVLRES